MFGENVLSATIAVIGYSIIPLVKSDILAPLRRGWGRGGGGGGGVNTGLGKFLAVYFPGQLAEMGGEIYPAEEIIGYWAHSLGSRGPAEVGGIK